MEHVYLQKLEPYFPDKDKQLFEKLIDYARYLYDSLYRYSGESYFERSLRLTCDKILNLNPDQKTIILSVLISATYSPRCDLEKIKSLFGKEIAFMVESIGKINAIKSRYTVSDNKVISKMFLTLAKDIRVILVRLMDRIDNLETLKFKSKEKQKANAREILEVYVPIASQLGLYGVTLELEDLAFKHVYPDEYKMVSKDIDDYMGEANLNINKIKNELEHLLKIRGFNVEIFGRIKNTYSIYKKLKRKNKSLDQIYDIFAMRIILKTDCDSDQDSQENIDRLYQILSILHSKYTYLPDRFKDYIATPKDNGYVSLHTSVIGLNEEAEDKPTEIQIRTDKMHKLAEYGLAAHWVYKHSPKEAKLAEEKFMNTINALRQNMNSSDQKRILPLKMDLYNDRVFIMTPDSLVLELPKGATPVDFAYAIHSDLGHSCYLAKVNGSAKPLDYKLKNGDQVEIIRGKVHNPKMNWLSFVVTKQARNRIKNFYRNLERKDLYDRGKEELNEILKQLNLDTLDDELFLLKNYKNNNLPYKERELIIEEIGAGNISANTVFKNIFGQSVENYKNSRNRVKHASSLQIIPRFNINGLQQSSEKLIIGGEKNIPFKLSNCCKPSLHDEIVAYVTLNRGVSIHRMTCNFMKNANPHRVLEAKLEDELFHSEKNNRYKIALKLLINHRKGYLKDLLEVLLKNKYKIIEFSDLNKLGNKLEKKLVVEILNNQHLEDLVEDISMVSGTERVLEI